MPRPEQHPHFWTLGAIAVTTLAVTVVAFHLVQSALYWSFSGESLLASIELSEQIERLELGQFRLVRAAGTMVNLLLALALFPAVRPLRNFNSNAGFFAWLGATLNGVAAGAYPIISTALNRGDWAWFTVGAENALGWKIAIFLAGGAVTTAAISWSRVLVEGFLGRDSDRGSILSLLTSTSCVAWIAGGVLLLIFHPASAAYAFVGPAAAFTGAAGLVAIYFRSRLPRARTPHRPDRIENSAAWLFAGAVSLVALVAASSTGFLR